MRKRTPAGHSCVLALLLLAAAPLAGQRSDSVTVVAGPRYGAEGLKATLLGREYRDLWTAPTRVEVLDLGTFAGGLTPTETGGGNQTLSLRFRGADGREYAFRSVDKDPLRNAHPDMQGTFAGSLLRDQVSSLHPTGPLAADRLLAAAGVLHIPPRLFVMPDDPRLGQFRQQFAGMLGMMEERPEEDATGIPGLAEADDIEGTEDFLEALDEGAENRLDARDYLAVRLMDVLLGDWDRHEDQYRWARFDQEGRRTWRAVGRDRDYVFVDYDGLVAGVVRSRVPNAVRFRPGYRGQLRGLTVNAEPMDRRLLGELPREAWEAVAATLVSRLSDAVIDDAVRRLPPEHRALDGADLARTLRGRRDDLPQVAAELYRFYAREGELHGTAQTDVAEVERLPDGSVEVRLYAGDPAAGPYLRRRFVPAETREVRVYLRGGADRARVYGAGPAGIVIRVIGGAGDDTLADDTRDGHAVAFYDHEGDNRISPAEGTRVDRRAWEAPVFEVGGGRTPPRFAGVSMSWFSPSAEWRRHAGPTIGIGPSRTRWGFRRAPFATDQSLRLLFAPLHSRFGVEYRADFRYPGSPDRFTVLARVSELEATGFYGFGNDTPEREEADARVWEQQVLFEPAYTWGLRNGAEFTLAAVARRTDPDFDDGAPAALTAGLEGADAFTVGGGRAAFVWDRRDSRAFPTRGFAAAVAGGAYPIHTGGGGPFGDVRASASAYAGFSRNTVLALRAGGQLVEGEFPFQYAAFLGGSPTLRGYPLDRFAGDRAVNASAELRQVLTRAEILVRGDLGVFALADAGRVWYDGDGDGGWNTAYGGGAFFTFLGRGNTITVTYAQGERGIVYFAFGVPF